jgi:hypothetical protein
MTMRAILRRSGPLSIANPLGSRKDHLGDQATISKARVSQVDKSRPSAKRVDPNADLTHWDGVR